MMASCGQAGHRGRRARKEKYHLKTSGVGVLTLGSTAHFPITVFQARAWRVADRLCDAEKSKLITAFIAGTPNHELAKTSGIDFKNVKKLLRAHWVRKPSGWNPRI